MLPTKRAEKFSTQIRYATLDCTLLSLTETVFGVWLFFVKNESILGQCVSCLLALQSPCKVVSTLTHFLTTETTLPAYMAYPKFLLDMTDLGETAKLVYIVLLDRARVSQVKGGWTDENGNVFIFYPIRDLAKTIHKSEMSVKTALSALEKCGLILRKRQGVGKANRIYVKLPVDRNLSARQTENCPSDGKKTVCHMERKLSGNKNKESKTNKSKRRSKAYGKFQNVFRNYSAPHPKNLIDLT